MSITAILRSVTKRKGIMKKLETKKVKSQTSRLVHGAIVISVTTIVLGFASKGIAQYISGMNEDQKVLASVFVVIVLAYVIFTSLRKLK